jgi:hypothetical protein
MPLPCSASTSSLLLPTKERSRWSLTFFWCQARVDTPELVGTCREALMAQRFFESRNMFVKAALAVRANAASRHVPRGTSARVTSKGVLTIFTLQGVGEPRPTTSPPPCRRSVVLLRTRPPPCASTNSACAWTEAGKKPRSWPRLLLLLGKQKLAVACLC